MSHLVVQLPRFEDQYDGRRQRELVRRLEEILAKVRTGFTREPRAITTNTQLDSDDGLVLVDTSGGSITITLPPIGAAFLEDHKEFHVKKTATANVLYIESTENIDDSAVGVSVRGTNTSLTFRASSAGWKIV